jgi:hypothetical protein
LNDLQVRVLLTRQCLHARCNISRHQPANFSLVYETPFLEIKPLYEVRRKHRESVAPVLDECRFALQTRELCCFSMSPGTVWRRQPGQAFPAQTGMSLASA